MLKKKVLKKLCLIISCLLIVEIILLFPKEKEMAFFNNDNDTGVIYLLDDNNYVARLDYLYNSNNTDELIEEMINALTINNNKSIKIREGFKAVIPENTRLLDYQVDDNMVTLNFSKEFLNIDADIEEKVIEAILYSITSIKNINSLVIKIEGKILEKLPYSNKKISNPLNRSFKINKEYDLKSMHNINETTIFYLAKKNNYIYYIPVTKYTNTNKEKIEIIINELKSSSTYNTNLISYINEETELINYELLDNSLLLNFNEQILSDVNSNNIIEEVTYAINLSIKENYSVENVCYYINDNILNNYFLLLG